MTNPPELDALDFATVAHRGQMYGDRAYVHHLTDVYGVLLYYTDHVDFLRAGFLHDVLEDTDVTLAEIIERFGTTTGELVWACTGVGKTYEDQTLSILEKLTEYPPACLIKCADRIANVEAATPGDKYHQRYLAQQPDFATVVQPFVPPHMWDRLTAALERTC
jgi:(p)ppGpp synthase/HD superfamily hydrolase